MSFSNHLENIVLECIFGQIWYFPLDLWLGLSRGTPSDTGYGLDETWLVGTAATAPEGGGWSWLLGGSWSYVSAGTSAQPEGGHLYRKWFGQGEKPAEFGGFPVMSGVVPEPGDPPEQPGVFQVLTRQSGYQRVHVTPDDWYYSSQGVVANSHELTFPVATQDWGELTHWALFDSWYMTNKQSIRSDILMILGIYGLLDAFRKYIIELKL